MGSKFLTLPAYHPALQLQLQIPAAQETTCPTIPHIATNVSSQQSWINISNLYLLKDSIIFWHKYPKYI